MGENEISNVEEVVVKTPKYSKSDLFSVLIWIIAFSLPTLLSLGIVSINRWVAIITYITFSTIGIALAFLGIKNQDTTKFVSKFGLPLNIQLTVLYLVGAVFIAMVVSNPNFLAR